VEDAGKITTTMLIAGLTSTAQVVIGGVTQMKNVSIKDSLIGEIKTG
jgi:hypothetical protein